MNDQPDLGADGPAALARHTQHATFRGRIVARTVASDTLEALHAAGVIDDRQMKAGLKLRAAYLLSWPTHSRAAKLEYVSDGGIDDESGVGSTEEEREAKRIARFNMWQDAMQHLGVYRHVTLGLCGGPVILRGAQAGLRGLTMLADFWKIQVDNHESG